MLSLALALTLVQDTSTQQQQAQQLAGAVAGMMGVFFLIWLVIMAFVVFCFWRIFSRAGMAGALSLLIIIPGIGPLIVICLLAFGDWKVVPIGQAAPLPPPYQPPPSYPPASYPPSQPPTA